MAYDTPDFSRWRYDPDDGTISACHPTKIGMRYTFANLYDFDDVKKEEKANLIVIAPEMRSMLLECLDAIAVMGNLHPSKNTLANKMIDKINALLAKLA